MEHRQSSSVTVRSWRACLRKLELGLKPRHTFDLDAAFFDEYKK
jgi:hypothetical protein